MALPWESRTALVLLLSTVAAFSGGSRRLVQANQSPSQVVAALERYGRGEFVAAVRELVADRSLRAAASALRRDGGRWIDGLAPELRPRALAVTSALVLELVAQGVQGTTAEYGEVRPLVEWMCQRWRAQRPSPAEGTFHLGIIALLQGAGDEGLLVGKRSIGREAAMHIQHAADRFPAEPRFKLAWLVARHEARIISAYPVMAGYLRMGTAYLYSVGPDGSLGDATPLKRTIDALGLLEGDPKVGAEARLRRGVIRFALGEPEVALPDFHAATLSPDPFVRYLAHVMSGLTFDRIGRLSDAPSHYAAAVEIVPATSATVAWASALVRLGQATAGAELIAKWSTSARPDDPWLLYNLGDYRLYPRFLDSLRKGIVQ
jgi:hypothetical protein